MALDVERLDEADALRSGLEGAAGGCKIGSQLFTAAGPVAIEHALKRGYRVFLDLKDHDIPKDGDRRVREATRLGVFMLNVHAASVPMMRAAATAATKAARAIQRGAPASVSASRCSPAWVDGPRWEWRGQSRRTCCASRSLGRGAGRAPGQSPALRPRPGGSGGRGW